MKSLILLATLTLSLATQAADRFAVRGHQEAKVTLIVFGDFQCPFTKRGAETINQLLGEEAQSVKVVYRHFPLDFHEQARPAAIASVCANEQGEFWKMHDALFAIEAGKLTEETILQAADRVGLNKEELQKCRQSPSASAIVDQDMKEGLLLGLVGTPTYIFVGPSGVKRMSGAYPLEDMIKSVNEVK